MDNTLRFIGHAITPYNQLDDCPSNVDAKGPLCELVIAEEYAPAMKGLYEGRNILVLYWLDQAKRDLLLQVSPHNNDPEPVGTFALRSPFRPNPIGAASFEIEKISGNSIFVRGLDCLSGTKLVDIKPEFCS